MKKPGVRTKPDTGRVKMVGPVALRAPDLAARGRPLNARGVARIRSKRRGRATEEQKLIMRVKKLEAENAWLWTLVNFSRQPFTKKKESAA